tara:strand:- start:24525 stop:24788 length:264 start_codon:yes stop_codon:yes gene_type:complete
VFPNPVETGLIQLFKKALKIAAMRLQSAHHPSISLGSQTIHPKAQNASLAFKPVSQAFSLRQITACVPILFHDVSFPKVNSILDTQY